MHATPYDPGHYHLSLHTISKLKGHLIQAAAAYRRAELFEANSVTHAAAYQRAQELGNDGRVFDYRRKIGVVWTGILAPAHTPKELLNAQTLWNTVERIESRANARLAREMIIALPHQVNLDVHLHMLRAFITAHLTSRGLMADVAVHRPPVEHGGDPRNWHAHVLLTDRPMTPTGFARKKDRMLNATAELLAWRKAWADCHNTTMQALGLPHRISHLSLEAQRRLALERGDTLAALDLDREPQIHVGKAMHARHPKFSVYKDRRDRNEAILTRNKNRAALRADRMQGAIAKAENAAHLEAQINAVKLDLWMKPEPLPLDELRRRYGRPSTPPGTTFAIERQARKAQSLFDWSANDTGGSWSDMLAFFRAETAVRGPPRSVFTVTARDIAFCFYSWGLITRAQLQNILEDAWGLEAALFPRQTRNRAPVPPSPPPPVLQHTHARHLARLRQAAHVPEGIYLRRVTQLKAFEKRHRAKALCLNQHGRILGRAIKLDSHIAPP